MTMSEETSGIQIVSIANISASGRWRAELLHSKDQHLLLWFTKGQGQVSINGNRQVFGPNTVVYIPAGTPHSFELKPSVFGTAVLMDVHPQLEMPPHPILYRVRDLLLHGEFVGLFEAMQREVKRQGVQGQARACRLHAGILGVWLDRQHNVLSERHGASAAEILTGRYVKLLEAKYTSGTTVAGLAKELGVTPTHLSRACRSVAGVPAHQLLSDRIIYAARQRLEGDGAPIKSIANDLGFSSAAYFTRAFQKATGHTPSAFRLKH